LFLADPDQTMLTRSRLLLFLGALLIGNWPALLHAGPPGQMPPEKTPGKAASSSFLLVASKQMPDPRFHKTVLLVTRHGNAGPIGVIVNRPQDIKLDEIFPGYPAARELSLFFGGPVFPRQTSYLVRGGEAVAGALTVANNIYLAYDMPALGELLGGKRPYKDLRVMQGLASWAPGQLEYEIKLGGWYVMPFDEAVIFDRPPAAMWQELYGRANSIEL
jgi:putative transcriptional regulator